MAAKITQDTATGRITSSQLDSETARAMARSRYDKNIPGNEADLLLEAGYSDPNDAPASLRLIIHEAAKQGSRSLQALSAFLRFSQRPSGTTHSLEVIVKDKFVQVDGVPYVAISAENALKAIAMIEAKQAGRGKVDGDKPSETLQAIGRANKVDEVSEVETTSSREAGLFTE